MYNHGKPAQAPRAGVKTLQADESKPAARATKVNSKAYAFVCESKTCFTALLRFFWLHVSADVRMLGIIFKWRAS
jgi:hypothetical protein